MRISRIRLSDWFHRKAHGNGRRAASARRVLAFASRHSNRRTGPAFDGVRRLIGQSPDLAIFESAPEVRALSSAGVTRLQRSYDPVRLPPEPPPCAALRPLPSRQTGLPRLPEPPFRRAVPTTPADQRVRVSIASPSMRPSRFAGGSASASLLSRPAQASLALRPVGLLNRPRRPLSRGFSPSGYPAEPLVSYQSNRQFSGWNPPPLVFRAFGAHCKNQEF